MAPPKIPYGEFSSVSRPVYQAGLPVDYEFFASCSLHPPFVHLAFYIVVPRFGVRERDALMPPFKRLMPLPSLRSGL